MVPPRSSLMPSAEEADITHNWTHSGLAVYKMIATVSLGRREPLLHCQRVLEVLHSSWRTAVLVEREDDDT